MKKSWLLVCLINFFIAASMGLLLRLMYVVPMPELNYQFLLHGHSHIAMLGWVYMMLYGLIYTYFVPIKSKEKPIYNRLFWITEVAVVGMMLYFPVEGYALFSITFSTLHILCSYYFCRLVWKDAEPRSLPEMKLLKASLVFMVLSTCGVWCLGPAVGLLGKASAFYQIAIQFFLHFQFNGWFVFAVLALVLHQFQAILNLEKFNLFFKLVVVATVLTLALPVSWYLPNPIFYWINVIGICLQLFAFIVFVSLVKPHFKSFWNALLPLEKAVYWFAFSSLILKVGIQMVVIVPELAQVSHQIRNFVIGFIHLTMLGVVTGFVLAIALKSSYLNPKSRIVFSGVCLFLLGFVLTEVVLFAQGIYLFYELGSLPNYYLILFIVSVLLPASIGFLATAVFKTKQLQKVI